MKTLFATLALAGIVASPALAQTAAQRARIQQYPSQFDQSYGRTESSSLDGRVEGHSRTCGSDTFQYDSEGTPTGPYCH
jgi:hypothetical protein